MSSIGSDIVDQFNDKKEQLDKRDKKGFGGDVKDSDRKDSAEKEKKVYERLITAFTKTSRRRRRSGKQKVIYINDQLIYVKPILSFYFTMSIYVITCFCYCETT